MSSKLKELQVLWAYEQLFIKAFQPIKITEGGTKKSRIYSHLFIHGNYYGGKLGSLLCKKYFKTSHVYQTGETRLDFCKQCNEKLDMLAHAIIELRISELFGVSCGETPAPLTPDEVLKCLIRLREMEKKAKAEKQYPMEMFSAEETNVHVTRTSLAYFPRPTQLHDSRQELQAP
jgi:hypothetical protein